MSATPDDNSTPPSTKSKQERIRDNQRRSRARRQEYLADLERRLSECQMSCRSANIQRSTFLELQIENARLRELLELAGVNDQFVEQYVSQAIAQSGQFPQESNPALRQLKPKISAMESVQPLNMGDSHVTSLQAFGQQSDQTMPLNIPYMGMSVGESQGASSSLSGYTSNSSFSQPMPDINPVIRSFDWMENQITPTLQSQDSSGSFTCDTFLVPSQGPAHIADDRSVLCSVAKQMLDQYQIPPNEMEEVKAKLSQGFCRPPYPGAGCSVNNQTLFQVLNELSQKYS